MKQFMTRTLMMVALMGSASAQAAFIGDFASGNWTSNGPGSVQVNSPTSISLSDEVEYVADAPTTPGKIIFDFSAPNDPFEYCVNDVCTQLSGTGDDEEVAVGPGDEFKFVNAPESGPSEISNLRTIPEPATPALLGAGLLLGLALFGRRKSN